MNHQKRLLAFAISVLVTASTAVAQTPVGTSFTYQGRLNLAGAPVNDSADLQFTLYDAEIDGNTVGSSLAVDNVMVVDGLFTVELDFGVLAFNDDARWLEIAVRSPAGSGAFTTLAPRQPVTATPYAMQTRGINVDDQGTVTANAFVGDGAGLTNLPTPNGLWEMSGSDVFYSGGKVGVGTDAPGSELDVNGTATATTFVGEAIAGGGGEIRLTDGIVLDAGDALVIDQNVIDQKQTQVTGYHSSTLIWQSFTAGVTGELVAVELARFIEAEVGTMTIREGEGLGGAVLAIVSTPGVTETGWEEAELSTPVSLTAGGVYTIELRGPGHDWGWGYASGDTYAGGRSSLSGGGLFQPPAGSDLAFRTKMVQSAVVTVREGRVGIGRMAPNNALELEGNASKSTAGDWLANSDRRIKTNIETVSNALDTLDRVRLVSFKYTDEYQATHPGVGDGRYLNVIAQEFAQVFPDHVKGSGERLPDGSEILQVDTYPLTIYAAAAIQELRAENDALRQRLARLEALVAQINTID